MHSRDNSRMSLSTSSTHCVGGLVGHVGILPSGTYSYTHSHTHTHSLSLFLFLFLSSPSTQIYSKPYSSAHPGGEPSSPPLPKPALLTSYMRAQQPGTYSTPDVCPTSRSRPGSRGCLIAPGCHDSSSALVLVKPGGWEGGCQQETSTRDRRGGQIAPYLNIFSSKHDNARGHGWAHASAAWPRRLFLGDEGVSRMLDYSGRRRPAAGRPWARADVAESSLSFAAERCSQIEREKKRMAIDGIKVGRIISFLDWRWAVLLNGRAPLCHRTNVHVRYPRRQCDAGVLGHPLKSPLSPLAPPPMPAARVGLISLQ